MSAMIGRALRVCERMLLIRAVEERLIAEYPTSRIRMPVHLSIGQEGVAVGLFDATRPTDTVVGTHRSHALYLAKGGSLERMIDEFYSLPSGCNGGRGGSMHLADPSVGLLGSSAILGGGIPISVGVAFELPWVSWRLLSLDTRMESCRNRTRSRRLAGTPVSRRFRRCAGSGSCGRRRVSGSWLDVSARKASATDELGLEGGVA